jgi:D-3-phosphoglycerate dehydrogenase
MKIVLASPIHSAAIRQLETEHDVVSALGSTSEELAAHVRDAEILVVRSGVQVSAELLERAPSLRLLVRAGSGLDNIDLDAVRARGISFTHIPEPGAQAVAELAFAFMLALSRSLIQADRSMREGRWAKYELEGFLLRGKTLGIVGVGNIGSRVGEMGVAWGMNVIGCDKRRSRERERVLLERGIRLIGLDRVVSESDYLSIHVPLKASTRRLIGPEEIRRMKPGAILVNLARGGVVDEHALAEALEAGRLGGVALDVHEREGEGELSPLAGFDNVILTPHIGAMAVDTQMEIGRRIVQLVQETPTRLLAV